MANPEAVPCLDFSEMWGVDEDGDKHRIRVNGSGVVMSSSDGTWGYAAGTSGTETLTGSKRVLQITAVALESAGTITIDGGDTITIPYGSSDSVSTSITIEPRGSLVDPVLIFTGTDSFFVEYVS